MQMKYSHIRYKQLWQCLQLISHVIFTVWGQKLQLQQLENVGLLSNDETSWALLSINYEIRLFFNIQFIVWVCLMIAEVAFFARVQITGDSMMIPHHCITVSLIWIVKVYNLHHIGLHIIFLHDITDIAIDVLKILRFMEIMGHKTFPVLEIEYLITLAMWLYYRLYYFPFFIIMKKIAPIYTKACLAEDGDLYRKQFTTGNNRIVDSGCLIIGLAIIMLGVLLVMQFVWFYILILAGIKQCKHLLVSRFGVLQNKNNK